jgi:hypothetical protein
MRLTLTGALLAAAWLAQQAGAPVTPPVITTPGGSAAIEQVAQGNDRATELVERFDGLGAGFTGPHGTTDARNPSDNSLAVGPDHIVQIVNARMAIYTKRGKRFDATARVLYGPVVTNTLFKGFGGACEERVSGDAVVRYDQLAGRWLFVLPVFQRGPVRAGQAAPQGPAAPAQVSRPGRPDQPGAAVPLYVPPRADRAAAESPRARNPPPDTAPLQGAQGPYSMCYAISTGSDPLGAYFRYEFLRPLFPDYPRPAIWRTATTCPRASATIGSPRRLPHESRPASWIAQGCSRARRLPSSASSSTT